jgi:hypothetical protein
MQYPTGNTVVLLPGLRGAELAQQVAEIRPDIRVIYISGSAQSLREAAIPEDTAPAEAFSFCVSRGTA